MWSFFSPPEFDTSIASFAIKRNHCQTAHDRLNSYFGFAPFVCCTLWFQTFLPQLFYTSPYLKRPESRSYENEVNNMTADDEAALFPFPSPFTLQNNSQNHQNTDNHTRRTKDKKNFLCWTFPGLSYHSHPGVVAFAAQKNLSWDGGPPDMSVTYLKRVRSKIAQTTQP